MELDETIRTRRTCRDFKPKDVSLEKIAEILDLSTLAPSSGNLQNWHFIVVKDQDKKEKIADICEGQTWMTDASALITVCNDPSKCESSYPQRGEIYARQNCAIVSAFITLKAVNDGLATAIVGAFNRKKLSEELDIPSGIIPEMVIALGHPNDLDEDQPRDEIKHHVSFEKWGKSVVQKGIWPISKPIKQTTKKVSQAANRAKLKTSGLLRKTKEKIKKL